MDLRGELIRLLGLASYQGDEDILKEIKKLKGENSNQISAHSAVEIANLATAFQKKAADAGVQYQYADCVRRVMDGDTW